MHNLSMVQALSIWSDLESAFFGKNGFGGDTAEIYIYRAQRYTPSLSGADPANVMAYDFSISANNVREAYDNANEALCLLFQHFAETREAYIEVDGRALGDWLKTARYTHRIHVRVTPSRGR